MQCEAVEGTSYVLGDLHVPGLTGSFYLKSGRKRSVKIRDQNTPSVKFPHAEEITEVLPSVIISC